MSTQELIFLNYLSKVFENLDDAIVLCELRDGVVEPVMVNRGFYEITGYTKDDNLSKIGEVLSSQPSNKAFLERTYEMLGAKEVQQDTTKAIVPNGTIELRVKAIPVLTSLGEVTHVVFIARDITADLAKDQQIAKLEAKLNKN